MAKDTKLNLNNEKFEQLTNEKLSLSGSTFLNALSANTFSIVNEPINGSRVDSLLVRDNSGEIKQISQENFTSERIEKTITQSSHGFVVGDVIGANSGSYSKSLAISTESEILGIVTEVNSVNEFTVTYAGFTDQLSGMTDTNGLQLSADTVYYASPNIPGKLTSNIPINAGNITKPMLYVIDGNDGNVLSYRANVVTSGDTQLFNANSLFFTGVTISGDNTTTVFPVNHDYNSRDVLVQIYEDVPPYENVIVLYERTDNSTITVIFNDPPQIGENFRVLIFSGTEGSGNGGSNDITLGQWINIDSLSSEITNTQIPLQYRFDSVLDSEIVYFRGQFGRNINSIDKTNWIIGNIPSSVRPSYDYITYREKGGFEYKIVVESSTGNIIISSVANSILPVTSENINDSNPYQINDAFYRPNNPFNVELSDRQDFVEFNPESYAGIGSIGSQTALVSVSNTDSVGNVKTTIKDYDITIEETKVFDDTIDSVTSSNYTILADTDGLDITFNQSNSSHISTQLSIINSDNPILTADSTISWDFVTTTTTTSSPPPTEMGVTLQINNANFDAESFDGGTLIGFAALSTTTSNDSQTITIANNGTVDISDQDLGGNFRVEYFKGSLTPETSVVGSGTVTINLGDLSNIGGGGGITKFGIEIKEV